jgi:uncharacterized membrane protein
MHYVTAFVGGLIGLALGLEGGVLLGVLLGLGGGLLWQQARRIRALEQRLDALGGVEPPAAEPLPVTEPPPAAQPAADRPQPAVAPRQTPAPVTAREQSAAGSPPPSGSPPRPATSGLTSRLEALREALVRFLTTGNPVVRIGVIVLFIGVAFLLRYAYEHALVPVELRLAGAGLGGIVLLAFGWRLRERADTYGLILQGAGIGILYLTIFAAARLYDLLPMGAAFAILVLLVIGASVLAVVQKSQALAIFSMSGGFLAPVLTSTGEGSHVALFSYYALLNAGILVMAWFRHWRWLNWTGFVFTFVIGASWGYQYYQPEYYASTQPFLILFFGFYLGVSVLFARRDTVDLKGVVDGTLVFGTPVIAFMLQAALVRDMAFGLAYSALVAALVYTGLAIWLKRIGRISALLDESFGALAVVFATLAIPFAFDNQRFTAAAWALEGAGIVWIGLRQSQRLPRLFGMLLQLGAGAMFIWEIGRATGDLLFFNSAYLGAAMLGVAGVFSACQIARHRDSIHRLELGSRWFFLGWGVVWWLAGGVRELGLHTPGEEVFAVSNLGEHLFLIYAAASVVVLTVVARALDWRDGLLPGLLLLPLGALILVNLDISWERGTALAQFGWVAWPAMVGVVYWHLRHVDDVPVSGVWHAGGWWFIVLFLTWNAAAVVDGLLDMTVWTQVLWGAVPLIAGVGLIELRHRRGWPFEPYAGSYFGWGWLVLLGYLLLWLLVTGPVAGDPTPIPYIVLINPLELVQLGVLLLATFWLRRLVEPERLTGDFERFAIGALGVVGFVWINFVAVRAVHFYAGVPYPIDRIFESDAFQTTVTILWTSIALVLMGIGARRSVRMSWLVGAGLLIVVILKLFLLDLGRLDLVSRIVSFISVGVLMLVIGYFAPLPPKRMEAS